jgi:cob(I)alamin adenosyltransferase
MGYRLTKLYTRTGDNGTTGLADGSRIDKSSLRIDVMGDIDELNSLLGLLICESTCDDISGHLQKIQHILFNLGGSLSLPDQLPPANNNTTMTEQLIDQYNADLPPLKEFILPGGSREASICHVARSVCRRVERKLVKLGKSADLDRDSMQFINRLSDLLFVFARVLARKKGDNEVYWKKDT